MRAVMIQPLGETDSLYSCRTLTVVPVYIRAPTALKPRFVKPSSSMFQKNANKQSKTTHLILLVKELLVFENLIFCLRLSQLRTSCTKFLNILPHALSVCMSTFTFTPNVTNNPQYRHNQMLACNIKKLSVR